MINAYKSFWMNYFNFKGKTGRKEFWLVILIQVIISKCLDLIDVMGGENYELFDLLYLSFFFGSVVPLISLAVRRLNDCGKKWYHLIFGIIPFIGTIYLLVLLLSESIEEMPQRNH